MENEIIKCKHQYEPVIIKVQERYDKYVSSSSSDGVTLNQERLYIFCNKCGDNKKI